MVRFGLLCQVYDWLAEKGEEYKVPILVPDFRYGPLLKLENLFGIINHHMLGLTNLQLVEVSCVRESIDSLVHTTHR